MKVRAIICVLSLFLLSSCDSHKEERGVIQGKITKLQMDVLDVQKSIDSNQVLIDKIDVEINNNKEKINRSYNEYAEYKKQLSEYIMDNKAAALATAAGGGSVAALVSKNLNEDQKNALTLVALASATYCIFNFDTCQAVGTRILWYGSQMEMSKNAAEEANQKSSEFESMKNQYLEARGNLSYKIKEIQANISRMRESHDKLLCKFPICF